MQANFECLLCALELFHDRDAIYAFELRFEAPAAEIFRDGHEQFVVACFEWEIDFTKQADCSGKTIVAR